MILGINDHKLCIIINVSLSTDLDGNRKKAYTPTIFWIQDFLNHTNSMFAFIHSFIHSFTSAQFERSVHSGLNYYVLTYKNKYSVLIVFIHIVLHNTCCCWVVKLKY